MDLTHYRIFDERRGNPPVDNRMRRINRHMSRTLRQSFRVQVGREGRRRKKALTKTTMLEMIALHVSVMALIVERQKNED